MKKPTLLLTLTIVFAFITCSKQSATPKVTYTVTFVTNGGNTIAPIPVNSGNAIAAPASPTKAGCTFVEWDTDMALTKKFDFTTTITANTTLYAKWSVITYTVTFVPNGGNTIAPIPVNSGSAIAAPASPTKAGCTFVEWDTDAALTKKFDFTTTITANTTLYAKWSVITYTVTFNSNGGSAVTDIPANYNTAIAEPTSPTKVGCTFGGWYSNVALTTTFIFSTPITSNITLYAQWTFTPVVSTVLSQVTANGIAVDVAGNVYVAEVVNHSIQKITPQGVVSTIAGGGQGYADGLGTAARFNTPRGIAVGQDGNIYVADFNNHRIRKVTPAGEVSTLAGNLRGYAEGVGTAAQFNQPTGLVLDAANNLYVTDQINSRIRIITPTLQVSTFAGSSLAYKDDIGTAAKFFYPNAIAIDAGGNFYVTDFFNKRIRKITPGAQVTTLAGYGISGTADGIATVAQFNFPLGIAVDATGHVYIADTGNNSIRKITPEGVVSTFAGTSSSVGGYADGPATSAQFSSPYGVAVDANGNVYIADQGNHLIRKIQTKP